MKKLFLIASAALVLAVSPVAAASTGDIGNDKLIGVDFNPFSLLLFAIDGSVEMKMPIPQVTARAQILYSPNYFWVSNMSGLDLQATGRFYFGPLLPFNLDGPFAFLKKGPLQGLYAGGGVSIHSWGWTYYGSSLSYFSPGVVIEVGAKYFGQDWSWWPKNFYVEAGTQVDLTMPAKWKYSSGGTGDWTGVDAPYSRGGFSFVSNVGYAF